MKKGYNYPIKTKIALAKNYSVGLALLLYHDYRGKSIQTEYKKRKNGLDFNDYQSFNESKRACSPKVQKPPTDGLFVNYIFVLVVLIEEISILLIAPQSCKSIFTIS